MPGAAPVCPRHPDRVSYVRCQRCERPACPQCQQVAPVGVHCVDCVREARRTAPVPRSVVGAPLRGGRPVVTLSLIGLAVASYLLELLLGAAWFGPLAFVPALGESQPWRFVTTAFLHDPGLFLHIGFNMLALWVLGNDLEPTLGRARFATLYGLSALGGSVLVTVLAAASPDDSWFRPVVGASGAVFGLFGALLVILRRLGRNPAPILGILAVNAVIGFLVPRISWEAHVGGFVVGLLLGAAYAYAPKARRRQVAVAVPIGMFAALVAMAAAAYSAVG